MPGLKLVVMSAALLATAVVPGAEARGFSSGGAAAVSGGGAMGTAGAFAGGAAFGGGMGSTGTVIPRFSPFANFPFFGGGYIGYGYGQPFINQSFALPLVPPPEEVLGPLQINTTSPFAQPVVTGTRQVFLDGTPTTVTEPMIMEYHWPTPGKALASKTHAYLRTTHVRHQRQ